MLVYGVTGSGKTTMAEAIGRATGLPWFSVDTLTFEPGWVAVPQEEQRRRITEICAGDAWILDTAYKSWLEVPLERVQVVVALDYPRWFSLQRLVRRTIARAVRGTEICNGNRETFRMALSRESIVAWHFQSFGHKRRRMRAWAADPAGPRVVRFARAREAERWVAGLAGAQPGPAR